MTKEKKGGLSIPTLIFGIASSLAFFLFLLRSDIAIDYMKSGLKLCAHTVIPSLFPFMVISSLLISSGMGLRLCRPFAFVTRLLFGVSEGGACAFILGVICGFPIGAKVIANMYDRGMITKKEAERVMTFCNNPGSAFVISAVGVSLFGSLKLGVALYACVILSAVIVGVAGRIFCKGKKCVSCNSAAIKASLSATSGEVTLFTSAVQDSAIAMLTVCAMVVFFSSLIGCIGVSLSGLGVPDAPISIIFAVFELSSGVGAFSTLDAPLSIILCAAALGWSGLSVHFQVTSISAGRGFSFIPYFIAKGVQGLVCASLAWAVLKFMPFSEDAFLNSSIWDAGEGARHNILFATVIFFTAAILGMMFCHVERSVCKKNHKKKIKNFQKGVDKSNYV